ncbi:MAG: TetR/AcrR family transcriptional regulator [Pseudomonadota bacterium]
MAGKRDIKRAELKSALIKAATSIISEEGVRGLNSRNVTTKAGCALGSLYTAFKDLDDLIIHVNSQTLARLGEALQTGIVGEKEPTAVLKRLAKSYIGFAESNFSLWNALFEFGDMTDKVPDWHQQDQELLVRFIKEPVHQLSPNLSETEALQRSRTLFAAVHGIVAFSLQNRFIGLKMDELEDELMRFIDQMLAGL